MNKYSQVRGIPLFRFGYMGASRFVVVVNFLHHNIAIRIEDNTICESWWTDTTYDSSFVDVDGIPVRLSTYNYTRKDRFSRVQPEDCVRIMQLIQRNVGNFGNPVDFCPTYNLKREWYRARTQLLSAGGFLYFLDIEVSMNQGLIDLMTHLREDCDFFFPSLLDLWETFYYELDLLLPGMSAEDLLYKLHRLYLCVKEKPMSLRLKKRGHECVIPKSLYDSVFLVLVLHKMTRDLSPNVLDEDSTPVLYLKHLGVY